MVTAISFTGQTVEAMAEDVEYKHFVTTEPITIPLGETAGHVVVTESSHFVVASLDTEPDEMTKAVTGVDRVNESSVFVSNEGGELGVGLFRVEDGDMDDALEQFEEEYLQD